MEIEWADPPDGAGKYEAFFEALRSERGRWAKFPGLAWAVRQGKYAGCEAGEFEARESQGETYVRFVGKP